MNFYIMTLFPEMVKGGLHNSIIKRAVDKELIRIEALNIRDFTLDKHKKVDDYPFGGGAGMLMQAQPVYDCYRYILNHLSCEDSLINTIQTETTQTETIQTEKTQTESEILPKEDSLSDRTGNTPAEIRNAGGEPEVKSEINEYRPRTIYLSPQGKTFTQQMATELAGEKNLILLCGHYEGIDQRVLDRMQVEEVSIGDYVLTGGELPAMVMVDTIARLVPGVLNNDASSVEESFSGNLLEYPQYTRPEEWEGEKVPEVLLSGHHLNIEKWRKEKAIENTKVKRPDLYEKYLEEVRELKRKR